VCVEGAQFFFILFFRDGKCTARVI
jgi:hypothetical protein